MTTDPHSQSVNGFIDLLTDRANQFRADGDIASLCAEIEMYKQTSLAHKAIKPSSLCGDAGLILSNVGLVDLARVEYEQAFQLEPEPDMQVFYLDRVAECDWQLGSRDAALVKYETIAKNERAVDTTLLFGLLSGLARLLQEAKQDPPSWLSPAMQLCALEMGFLDFQDKTDLTLDDLITMRDQSRLDYERYQRIRELMGAKRFHHAQEAFAAEWKVGWYRSMALKDLLG